MRFALLAFALTACDLVYPLVEGEEGPCSTTESVSDEFDDGVLQPVWRTGFFNEAANAVNYTGTGVEIQQFGTTSASFLETVPFFELQRSSFTIEIAQGGAFSGDNFIELQLQQPGFAWALTDVDIRGNALVIRLRGDTLQAGRYVDGVFGASRNVPYDPTTMFAWKIAERDGEVIWSAGDGTSFTELQRALIAGVGMVRPRVLAYQGTDGSFTTTIDRANAGIAPVPACAAATLRDTFDAELDPEVWSEIAPNGCALLVMAGKLVVSDTPNGSDCFVRTGTVYDLYRGGIAIDVDRAAPGSDHLLEIAIETATDIARFTFDGNDDKLQATGANAPAPYAQTTFDPVAQRFLRFRSERNDLMEEQLIWETSPDGGAYDLLTQTGDYTGLDRVRFAIRVSGNDADPGTIAIAGVNAR